MADENHTRFKFHSSWTKFDWNTAALIHPYIVFDWFCATREKASSDSRGSSTRKAKKYVFSGQYGKFFGAWSMWDWARTEEDSPVWLNLSEALSFHPAWRCLGKPSTSHPCGPFSHFAPVSDMAANFWPTTDGLAYLVLKCIDRNKSMAKVDEGII